MFLLGRATIVLIKEITEFNTIFISLDVRSIQIYEMTVPHTSIIPTG